MKQGWEYKKLDSCAYIEYGTRVVQKKDGGTIYPVYGGGGETFRIDRFNREDCLIVARFAMSPLCVRYVKGKFFLNDSGLSVKAGKELYQSYLNHHIKFLNDKIYNLGKGAAQRNLDIKSFKNLQIGIPPKSTQLAIVFELDKINELIRLKKEQLKDFDNLAQSIFYEMFGDPVENEKGWEVKKLGDSIKVIGGYAFCSKNFLKSGIPVLRIGNINTGKFTPTNMVYWQKDEGLSRYRILPGDLVISLTGTVGKSDYGNVCILGNDYEEYYLNQRNAKLEVSSNLNKYFLTYLLKQDMIRKKLTGINRGVRQANIANRDIENLNIPLPPLPLQHLFAQRIEQIEHQKAEVQKAIADLETLLASRMQYWFE